MRKFFRTLKIKEAELPALPLAEKIKKSVKVEEGSFLILSSLQTKTDKSVWFTDNKVTFISIGNQSFCLLRKFFVTLLFKILDFLDRILLKKTYNKKLSIHFPSFVMIFNEMLPD